MPSVLIIEDEVKLLRSLTRGLREEGYTVLPAQTAAEGFRLAASESVDAVVLDLMLPDQDGFSVLRDLRRDGFSPPVLIVTARDAVSDRVFGLDSGADDYLVKPFAFSELLARLRALLRRSPAPPVPAPVEETRLRAGHLELDLLQRSVTIGGDPIPLTNRQFALLEYLVRNANQTVTREMIVRDVWKDPSCILTNVVDVSINHLRRKIERHGLPQILHTVRGVGYELRDDTCRV